MSRSSENEQPQSWLTWGNFVLEAYSFKVQVNIKHLTNYCGQVSVTLLLCHIHQTNQPPRATLLQIQLYGLMCLGMLRCCPLLVEQKNPQWKTRLPLWQSNALIHLIQWIFFFFISQSWKHYEGKKTTALRLKKKEKAGCVFIKPTRGGTFITGEISLLSNFNGNPNNF